MEKEVTIISLVYIERLIIQSGFHLNALNWRYITFTSLVCVISDEIDPGIQDMGWWVVWEHEFRKGLPSIYDNQNKWAWESLPLIHWLQSLREVLWVCKILFHIAYLRWEEEKEFHSAILGCSNNTSLTTQLNQSPKDTYWQLQKPIKQKFLNMGIIYIVCNHPSF